MTNDCDRSHSAMSRHNYMRKRNRQLYCSSMESQTVLLDSRRRTMVRQMHYGYTQTLLHSKHCVHTDAFTTVLVTLSTHKHLYAETLLHTDAFTQPDGGGTHTLTHKPVIGAPKTFTQKLLQTQTLLHRFTFTHKHFYTQTSLHRNTLTHKPIYTQRLLHTEGFTNRHFYTMTLLHTDAFTHRRSLHRERCYTQNLLHTLLHTNTFTHRHFYTHTFTHKHFSFYTETLVHTNLFTHKDFYTQKVLHTTLLHRCTFTHKHFYTQTSLHRNARTHKPLCVRQKLLQHTKNRNFTSVFADRPSFRAKGLLRHT